MAYKTKNIYLNILQEEFDLPKDGQRIVKVLTRHPNHIFDVMDEDGEVHKAILHSRFQQAVWVKANRLVVIEDIEGSLPEIIKVPTEGYVKFLRKNRAIPDIFIGSENRTGELDLFVNTNQRKIEYSSSSECSSSSSDDENS